MKKLLSLLRKDLVLMKNSLPFTALLIVGVPLLFLVMTPPGTGLAAFSMTYVLALYMTVQSLAYYESKYRKAETVLNAAPYSRRSIVIARYLFTVLLYLVCLLVYAVLSLAIPPLETIDAAEAAIALALGSLVTAVLQPLTYRFGIEKTRYINMAIAIGIGIGFPFLVKAAANGTIDLSFLTALPPAAIGCAALALSCALLVGSAAVSVAVYNKKAFS